MSAASTFPVRPDRDGSAVPNRQLHFPRNHTIPHVEAQVDDNPQPGRRDVRDEIRGDKRKEETVMLSSENVADLVAQARADAAAQAPVDAAAPASATQPADASPDSQQTPSSASSPSSSGGGIPPIAYAIAAGVAVVVLLLIVLATR